MLNLVRRSTNGWGMHMGVMALVACLTLAAGHPVHGLSASANSPMLQTTPIVRVEPASKTVSLGSTFTVGVMIGDASDLGGYEFDLVFDPGVLEVVDVADGGFLRSTGRNVSKLPSGGPRFLSLSASRIAFGAYSYPANGSQAGPNGSGRLATITLRAISVGSTTLDLQNVQVTDTQGQGATLNVQDGSVTINAQLPTTWYFGEGYTGGTFDTYVLLSNPATDTAQAKLTFLKPDGSTVVKNVSVGPLSRETVKVDDEPGMGNVGFGTKVEVTSGPGIVAERAMYWSDYSGGNGGHNTIGATGLSTAWYFGEGYTGGTFDTYILLSNPDPTQTAQAKLTFLKPDGSTVVKNVSVGPLSRETVKVDDEPGMGNVGLGTKVEVTSGPGIVAERAMYWSDYSGGNDGHNTIGATGLSTSWSFGEGYTGGTFDTYILLSNPDETTDAQVQVTFLKPDGSTVVKNVSVPKKSRVTIKVDDEPGMGNVGFGTKVEVTSGPGIVAERAMYWSDYSGGDGGHCTIGHPG